MTKLHYWGYSVRNNPDISSRLTTLRKLHTIIPFDYGRKVVVTFITINDRWRQIAKLTRKQLRKVVKESND